MRFVWIKSAAPQASRELLVKQRTQLMNSARSQLAEHGLVAARGRCGFAPAGRAGGSGQCPPSRALVPVLRLLLEQIERLAAAITQLEDRIVAAARADGVLRYVIALHQRAAMLGTRSAQPIVASGHPTALNRPDT